jgi:hypothetical protein
MLIKHTISLPCKSNTSLFWEEKEGDMIATDLEKNLSDIFPLVIPK